MSKPISIQMYTVREITKTPDDYRKVLRQIAEIGYSGIEGGAPKDMKIPEFNKFLADLGMKVSSNWATPTADSLQATVDMANQYGIKQLVGCWGPEHFADLDAIKKTAEHFEQAAQLLKPHGLDMLYHNHWWEFTNKIDGQYGWDLLMAHAPTLKCEIDLYWASNFGQVDVPTLVRKYARRTPLVHAKDGPLVKDQPNTAVGSGKFDITSAINATDPGTLQWVVVELDEYVNGAEKMMDAVRDSYRFLTSNGLASGRK